MTHGATFQTKPNSNMVNSVLVILLFRTVSTNQLAFCVFWPMRIQNVFNFWNLPSINNICSDGWRTSTGQGRKNMVATHLPPFICSLAIACSFCFLMLRYISCWLPTPNCSLFCYFQPVSSLHSVPSTLQAANATAIKFDWPPFS